MGHEHCGICNTVPCECSPEIKKKVPRWPVDKTEEWDMREKKNIMPDIDGRSDARKLPSFKIESVPTPLPAHNAMEGGCVKGEVENPGRIWDPLLPYKREQIGDGKEGGGMRFNEGKPRFDLMPPEWELALVDILTQGAKKYAPRNWEQGMKWSSMVRSMRSHLNKFLAGERYDGSMFDLSTGETGCHHLAMVAWNALALMSYDIRKIGENDLPKEVQLELFDRVNGLTSDLGVKIHEDK